ncbi:PilZ domain-containing protein [Candidatus Omnitrophota bacterium]
MSMQNSRKNHAKDEPRTDKPCYRSHPSFPYLPLGCYEIPDEIIKIIPFHLAKKYCVVPVEKIKNIVCVVMEDPCDKRATKIIEDFTGCVVRKFVGKREEILSAIARKEEALDLKKYSKKGELNNQDQDKERIIENIGSDISYSSWIKDIKHRGSLRFKNRLHIYFPNNGSYLQSETIDVSYSGIAFKSSNKIPLGTYLCVKIDLPDKVLSRPILLLVCVTRAQKVEKNTFYIGAKILEGTEEDVNQIIDYVSAKSASQKSSHKGPEKRRSVRYKTKVDLWFPKEGSYLESQSVDISRNGLLFISENEIPVGTHLPLEINLPKEIIARPIAWLTKVVRTFSNKDSTFIGVERINAEQRDMKDTLIKYASTHICK